MSTPTPRDDRAISEIMGTVLLVSLVLFGSATVIVLGADAINEAQQSTQTETAAAHLQQLDAQLSTLSAADDDPQTEFDPRDGMARQFTVERDGYINVTVNDNPTCSFQQNFSTIVYEDSQGRTVGYEAGGVWRGRQAGGSSAISPPDVTFVNGRLGVELVNLTGHVDQSINVARLNRTATRNRTRVATDALRQGDCVRPDNLTIRVESRFQAGWRTYLASETGVDDGNVTTFSNGSVKVFVNQSYLHPSVNDSENNIVNLADPPYMNSVTLDGSPAPPTVGVDKGVNNTYSVFVEPLTKGQIDIAENLSSMGLNLGGPPTDVVLVLDESGSMGGTGGTKWENAQDGAKRFVGSLNPSRDRVSVVSYDSEARYRYVDESGSEVLFSNDWNAVNVSIEESPSNGQTAINLGMEYMNAVYDLKSDQNRRKVAVLLTDGDNTVSGTPDADTLDAADLAADRGITVHTIGYGSGADETLMRDVANRTGGSYCFAADASAVQACYDAAADSLSANRALGSIPMTSNVSTSTNRTFGASIPGNTSHIGRISAGNNSFLNINDPTAPSLFSHSFAMTDGETASFNVSKYDCKAGGWNITGVSRTVNGSAVPLARCTDIDTNSSESFDAEIYIDGDRPDQLLNTRYEPWQTDVNTTLVDFPSVNIDSSTGVLEAKSNQALVVFDLPPEDPVNKSRNTFTLLVQIGLAESEGQGIVDVSVTEAELSNS